MNTGIITELDYDTFAELARQMRISYAGEYAVKNIDVREEWLSPTAGMLIDRIKGGAFKTASDFRYSDYVKRSEWPTYVEDHINTTVGLMNKEEPVFVLPESYEYLEDSATINAETLADLYKNITFEQSLTGRTGVLLSFDKDGIFYSTQYFGENIINYSQTIIDSKRVLDKVVLREIDDNDEYYYRILALQYTGDPETGIFDRTSDNFFYYQYITDSDIYEDLDKLKTLEFDEMDSDFTQILYTGNQIVNFIPFQIINSTNTNPEYQKPINLSLSDLALHYYRKSADLEQHLHYCGQDTAFFSGVQPEEVQSFRFGMGVLNSAVSSEAKFEMVGIEGKGIEYQQSTLAEVDAKAKSMMITFIESANAESGRALDLRLETKVLKLIYIVLTASSGLTQVLRFIPKITGSDNADEFEVIPNLTFFSPEINPQVLESFRNLVLDKTISKETLIEMLQKLNVTKKTMEEEAELIENNIDEGVTDEVQINREPTE